MEIQTFQWATDVYCGSSVCARLARVVIDPEKATVTDLVLEQGLLMKKAWVVPRRYVQEATAEAIWLTLAEDELLSSRPYKQRVIEELAQGYEGGAETLSPTGLGVPDMTTVPTVRRVVHDGVSSSELRVLGPGISVRDLIADRVTGKLKQLIVDAHSGEILRLVVTKGLLGEESILPATVVTHFDEDRVTIQEAPQGEPSAVR